MVLTLLTLTLWLLLTVGAVWVSYNAGKKTPKNNQLTKEEKRILEKERRELENFWKYTGDSQEGFYGK